MGVSIRLRSSPDSLKVLAVATFAQLLCELEQLRSVNPSGVEGDLLGAGDPHPLPALDRADEFCRLDEALGRAGVKPGVAPAHPLDVKLAALEISAVDIRDLKLPAR